MTVVSEAEALEREYRWLEAAGVHERSLEAADEKDSMTRGEIQEKIGYCLLRAAAQADSNETFRDHMRQVVEAYEKASEYFRGSSGPGLHCSAMIPYIGFWLSDNPDTRREKLDECLMLEKEALKAFEGAGEKAGIGKSCVELANYLSNRLDLELETSERERIIDEALELGEKAIEIFSDLGDAAGLSEAYCITSIHCYDGSMSMPDGGKIKECREKAFEYVKKAIDHSTGSHDKFVQGRATAFHGFIETDLGAGVAEGLNIEKEALKLCLETRDHRLIAEAYDGLSYCTAWGLSLEEDLEKIRERGRRGVEAANEAVRHSALVDYGHGIPHSHLNQGSGKIWVAMREVDPKIRHDLAEKGVENLRKGLELAQRTGSTHASFHLSNTTSSSISFLSTIKKEKERRKLLEEALEIAEIARTYCEKIRPYFYIVRGGSHWAVSRTQLELSKLEEINENKIDLLKKSIENLVEVINFQNKHIAAFPPRVEVFAGAGERQLELGNNLTQLYHLTGEETTLRRVIDAYRKAIENYETVNLTNRSAESYWKIAVIQNIQGEYLDSATSFENASKGYEQSVEIFPELKKFYLDHATYMGAWSEIEKARHYHSEKLYGEAKEHYTKTAELHESTDNWSYLAPNYWAWANLEEAESLSREEQTQEAKGLFENAANMFGEAKTSIKSRQTAIEDSEESTMVDRLLQASEVRREYCLGRMAMEDARTLDRQGDHFASSTKYRQAEESFNKIVDSMDLESDRIELRPIIFLCRAWQSMMMAEARASPNLYGEAADLFMQATENTVDYSTSLLAQAHSSFCRALEASTKFERNRDTALFTSAKNHIEAATSYYLRAGHPSASEYATATNRLLDAYMYTYNAQTETDPGKKARFYQLAERLLQDSAGLFLKAKHPEKSDEVRTILENIKGETKIALTLAELMHAPTFLANTSSFSTPTATHEQAVGLEKLENANIQANLILERSDAIIGEDLELELEMVNAGKAPAQLIKIEGTIPPGFEAAKLPDICKATDGYLDMKGRTLYPLKTEELKITLRPTEKGVFHIQPRILYLDETGKYRSHEPEPTTITVTELGVTGWLRGPRR